jgi:hypothetical protein
MKDILKYIVYPVIVLLLFAIIGGIYNNYRSGIVMEQKIKDLEERLDGDISDLGDRVDAIEACLINKK